MIRLIPLAAALALAGALVPLAGCSPNGARAGVGQPPALLYRHTTVPLTYRRAQAPAAVPRLLPAEMAVTRARTYYVGVNTPPGTGDDSLFFLRFLNVGWGDMSTTRQLMDASMEETIFIDARELNILGLFTRLTLVAYGAPVETGAAE